jgi:cellobiose transport system permease protein
MSLPLDGTIANKQVVKKPLLNKFSKGTNEPHRKRYNHSIEIAPYLFISPFFAIFLAFLIFPIIYTFYVSLTKWNGFTPPVFVGFNNYIALVKDARFYDALGNTLLFMVMIIPIQIILGLIVANILSSKIMIGKDAFRLLSFLPYLTAPVAIGMIFGILFDPTFGSINIILSKIGIIGIHGIFKNGINWTGTAWPARIMVSLVTIWQFFGYTAILFLAGITNINPEINEAAAIDGANGFQKLTKITIPLLKPVMIFVVLTTMIGCFQIFDQPFMLFSQGVAGGMVGGPSNSCLTAIWLLYDTAFGDTMRFGYGASIAYGLFVFITILSLITNSIMNRGNTDVQKR